jgi:hypothetical protein
MERRKGIKMNVDAKLKNGKRTKRTTGRTKNVISDIHAFPTGLFH